MGEHAGSTWGGLSDALDAVLTDPANASCFDGCDDDHEKLFILLVAATDRYVREICTRESGCGGTPLGELAVDARLLDDPSSFADLDRARYRAWLELTFVSLGENLDS